ncbi:MAG: ABC transporter permease subunit [Eubacteriales bacterium]|nr:ABC transporter permease subunit [Eubacteriales bacterium]
MLKLLSAGFFRLWKDKIFWLGFWVLTAFGALDRIGAFMDPTETHSLEDTFWIQALVIGFVLAAFISLFVGAEYENGTIRNKIASGHFRSDIYLANVIVCIVAGWLMCFGCLISSLLVGIPALGFFHIALSEIFLQGLCVFSLSAAYAAIFCFIAMLNTNRAVTAIISILLSFLLIFAGTAVADPLNQPQQYYIPDASLGTGEIDDGENLKMILNPDYLEGTERRAYEIAFEILPGGQSIQLSGMLNENCSYMEMFFASSAWVVLSCGCGLAFFRKKDLR